MSHKLFRLAKRYSNKPQLISQASFEDVLAVLENRGSVTVDLQSVESRRGRTYTEDNGYRDEYYTISGMGNVAVVDLSGPLTNKKTGYEAMCSSGISSYQEMKRLGDELAANANLETVVLEVDSGGGQAYGCFSAARYFRDVVKGSGKRIIAYVDGMACSAAYAWASIADEIVINPLAEAGSIGVIVHLMDTSVAMQQAGLRSIYITAGENKVPFEEDGTFKEQFLEEIQVGVDSLYDTFVSFVTEMRGLSDSDVRATEANVYSADQALDLGLVDRIMEIEDFYAELDIEGTVDTECSDDNNPPSTVDDAIVQKDEDDKDERTQRGDKDKRVQKDDDEDEEGGKKATSDSQTKGEMMTVKNSETAELAEEVVVTQEAAATEVVETLAVAAQGADLSVDLASQIAELQKQLVDQGAELNAAKVAQQALEATNTERQLAELTTQAKGWAFAGVDATAFAEAALTGMVPVEMMTTALEKATASMETLDSMQELGVAEKEPETAKKKDGVEAALADMKLKLRS